jgi:hypothetical protein
VEKEIENQTRKEVEKISQTKSVKVLKTPSNL